MKIQKKNLGGRVRGGSGWLGGGVRVDVNEELKFLCKLKKKFWGGCGRGGGGSGGGGSGWFCFCFYCGLTSR